MSALPYVYPVKLEDHLTGAPSPLPFLSSISYHLIPNSKIRNPKSLLLLAHHCVFILTNHLILGNYN